ncbi:3-methyladenine DNA glycosylase [Pseudoalteromonas rubra]|uniref:3-methyladenine DNA glycosylase n=1 Tax=Pseudoalteromonas rubra TaxID=43658 RepID=A0A5S3WP82_9GAMM|nr:DNA-3-methyladenine glycosylase I [Pseudoalteromonas rubra]TMP29991.1 3-methyladenine DNA glycosylase [Pseudoalteromonas rubra]TMP32219.1 3-methyladenine DNA glycosylase [Pseudoalteromonas rubra]
MESFLDIYERACERKGSKGVLESLLTDPLSQAQLTQLSDDVWLEEFTRKIFQSGFYWSVINAKWSGFREVFWEFSIEKLLYMSPEMYEQRAQDERIVRNYKKVQSVAHNCQMIHELALEYGKFSKLVANWPEDNIIELWLLLKKQGNRLGGNTGPYALRAVGKDTFILSRDVEAYLRAHDVISGGLHSLKSLRAAQAFFNELRRQSGYSLQKLSQLVAYSVGDNVAGVSS